MIYPSARAVVLAILCAIPAIAVALLVPGFWYGGLIAVAIVLALTAADAVAVAPVHALTASVEAPAAAFVGQRFAVTVDARLANGRAPQAVIEQDARLVQIAPVHDFVEGRGVALRPDAEGEGPPLTPPRSRGGEQLTSFAAVRRGSAALGALWVRWSGPFGLVWRQRRVPLDRHIAVLPDVRPVRAEALRLFRRDANIGDIVHIDRGAGGEFQALTDFRSGMDRRAIDWKASGRHGDLIAKEYRTEINNDIVFAIDAGRLMSEPVAGVPRIDRAITAALTAAFVALKLGDKVSLFGFDARPRIASGAVSGVQSFGTFQRLAAELDYSAEETNFTLALTTLGAQLKRRSLVLVFTDFADPTAAELMLKTVGRLAERHLVLFVLMQDVELEELADAAPATVDDVSRAVIAAAMLRERRIVVARLQRLGVHIVEARHDRLGPELVNAYLALKRKALL